MNPDADPPEPPADRVTPLAPEPASLDYASGRDRREQRITLDLVIALLIIGLYLGFFTCVGYALYAL